MRRVSDDAQDAGRRFSTLPELLGWGEIMVWNHLRARSRVLSLARGDDGVLAVAKSRVIYERIAS